MVRPRSPTRFTPAQLWTSRFSLAPRGANFTLQNCDLLLVVGARLDTAMTAYAHGKLAREAIKVMVDIDSAEIHKMKTNIELPIVADARAFLLEFFDNAKKAGQRNWSTWVQKCTEWKERYPLVLEEHRNMPNHPEYVSRLPSTERMRLQKVMSSCRHLGFAIEIFLLVLKIKKNQRCFHNRCTGSMGFALPAAIGAAIGSGMSYTCVDGDGGFQMNIQELATVKRLGLPIKFFVANNDGYASIRTSQNGYFKRLVGADPSAADASPLGKGCECLRNSFARIKDISQLENQVHAVLESQGPMICEILVAPTR